MQPSQVSEKRIKNLAQHNIELKKEVSVGKYSEVWMGELEGKEPVAIKFFTKDAMSNAMRELSFLGGVTHPYIIKYRKFVFEESAIVMDYAAGGNLYDYLKNKQEPIDWKLRTKWAKQIGETIKFLHEKGIIHRDLRAVNILLTDKLDVGIADFGTALWKGSGEAAARPVYVGKEHYKLTNDKATLTFNYDFRNFGIILAKLLLFGDDLDKDLWDTKTNSLNLTQLKCQYIPYLQLIELCLSPSSRLNDILESIESMLHDPQLPIPVEIIIPKYLEDMTNTTNEDARINASRALGELGIADHKVIEALVKALQDGNIWVRRYSAKSLAILVKKSPAIPNRVDVISALISTLESKDDKNVRVEAIRALGPIGSKDPKVASALISSSKEESPGLRLEVAEALREFQVSKEEVVSTLLKLLIDVDGWVRMKAASSLGKFKSDPRVTTALKEQIEIDTDLGVKWAAEASLSAMDH